MRFEKEQKVAKEICDTLGLKHVSKLDIHFTANALTTVDATFMPEIDGVIQFPKMFKKFKLVAIEDDVETTEIGDKYKSYK
jgi:hypothetical protein